MYSPARSARQQIECFVEDNAFYKQRPKAGPLHSIFNNISDLNSISLNLYGQIDKIISERKCALFYHEKDDLDDRKLKDKIDVMKKYAQN
mgnify:CR=1 FL=1